MICCRARCSRSRAHKTVSVDFQNARPPTAPTLPLQLRGCCRPAGSPRTKVHRSPVSIKGLTATYGNRLRATAEPFPFCQSHQYFRRRGSHDASSPTRRARPWPLRGARTKPESELQHRDANGPALAYVLYFEDETGRLMATHRLTRDEAIPSTSPKCAAQKLLK